MAHLVWTDIGGRLCENGCLDSFVHCESAKCNGAYILNTERISLKKVSLFRSSNEIRVRVHCLDRY